MDDLKADLLKDIDYLKNSGTIIDYSKENVYNQLFASSKYDYKTLQAVKDIISIISIDKTLKVFIPQELYIYFDDYYPNVYRVIQEAI